MTAVVILFALFLVALTVADLLPIAVGPREAVRRTARADGDGGRRRRRGWLRRR